MKTKYEKRKKASQPVGTAAPFVPETTWGDLIVWQTWQLHAALRKRLLGHDPHAVALIDALVRDFYLNWELQVTAFPVKPNRLIEALAEGQAVLGEVLPDAECYALMRLPVAG